MRLQFGPWEPDSAGLDSGKLVNAKNVYPSPIGYVPIPQLADYGADAIDGPILGVVSARTYEGAAITFVATRTKIYKQVGLTWVDVSRISGGDYNVPIDEYWSFAQFGSVLIAVNANDDPQSIDVDSGASNFAALGGSPPKARYVTVVNQFVFLGSLTLYPTAVQNSAIGDETGWTDGTDLSSLQIFPDGGRVTGLKGGEFGFLTQEAAVRRMIFQAGSEIAFIYERIEDERGCATGFGLVSTSRMIYFPASDGFYAFDGQTMRAIGTQRVNRWFSANSDAQRFFSILGFTDPYATRIYWAFYNNSSSTILDRLLIYDIALDRWTWSDAQSQYWGPIVTPGATLESLDAFGTLDGLPYSLDSRVWRGGRPVIAGFGSDGKLGFLESPMQQTAIIQTCGMHLAGSDRRSFSDSGYVVGTTNDATLLLSTGVQQTPANAVAWRPDTSPSALSGVFRQRAAGRIHHFRLTISQASGVAWGHAQGLEIEAAEDGEI